jgi:hypothetical protein
MGGDDDGPGDHVAAGPVRDLSKKEGRQALTTLAA